MSKIDRSELVAPAVASQVQRPVGRLEPERANVGDTVECDVREPHAQTHRLTLETQAAANYATKLLKNPNSGWRMARGCGAQFAPGTTLQQARQQIGWRGA